MSSERRKIDLAFDKKAGLRNSVKKFLGLADNLEDRQLLANTIFEGHPLKVVHETVLVGLNLITKRSTVGRHQDERCARAIDTAQRLAGLKPPEALRNIAVAAASLPVACYGNLWSLPSAGSVRKLTTATFRAETRP